MPKFRKKPVVIEAHQWFKNGDHPDDEVGGSAIDKATGDPYQRRTKALTHLMPTTASAQFVPEFPGHEEHVLLVRYSAIGRRVESCQTCGTDL